MNKNYSGVNNKKWFNDFTSEHLNTCIFCIRIHFYVSYEIFQILS